jgi:hypothetical protein
MTTQSPGNGPPVPSGITAGPRRSWKSLSRSPKPGLSVRLTSQRLSIAPLRSRRQWNRWSPKSSTWPTSKGRGNVQSSVVRALARHNPGGGHSGRRAARSQLKLALYLFSLSRGGLSWNPISWWDDATNAASSIVAPIENWVKTVVTWAIDAVEDDIDTSIDFVSTIIENIQTWAQEGFNDVETLAENIYHTVEGDIANAIDYAATIVENAVGSLINLIDDVATDVENVYNELYTDFVNGIGQVLGDIASAIETAESWAYNAAVAIVNDAIDAFYDEFIKPILSELEQVYDWITQVWQWFDTGVVDTWAIIIKAMDWIIWFAENPFHVFTELGDDVLGWAQTDPRTLFGSGQGYLSQIEDILSGFLGG